ncbi:MAG: hypothetical protein SGI87_10905, partial [Flavobacteriales bacterium]|nr:hypothetical protein [Flavobacteriales bacterium]
MSKSKRAHHRVVRHIRLEPLCSTNIDYFTIDEKNSLRRTRSFTLIGCLFILSIIPNHGMEISEFIGRTITLLHRVDSRIPQRINLK